MNEKFKELMLKAGYAWPEGAERAQKLFELIINECADLVEDFTYEQEVADGEYKEYDAKTTIKKYFGVE